MLAGIAVKYHAARRVVRRQIYAYAVFRRWGKKEVNKRVGKELNPAENVSDVQPLAVFYVFSMFRFRIYPGVNLKVAETRDY
jgi:hypothetical protein